MEKILHFLLNLSFDFSRQRLIEMHWCVTYLHDSEKCFTNQMIDDILIIVLLWFFLFLSKEDVIYINFFFFSSLSLIYSLEEKLNFSRPPLFIVFSRQNTSRWFLFLFAFEFIRSDFHLFAFIVEYFSLSIAIDEKKNGGRRRRRRRRRSLLPSPSSFIRSLVRSR